jgi:hypothetical protein
LVVAEVVNDGPVGRTQPVTVVVTGVQELGDTLFYAFDWNNDTVYEVGPQPGNAATQAFALSGAFTVGRPDHRHRWRRRHRRDGGCGAAADAPDR